MGLIFFVLDDILLDKSDNISVPGFKLRLAIMKVAFESSA